MIRFLRSVRRGRWLNPPEMSWLGDEDIQGDALCDIQTQGCKLSVFRADTEVVTQRVVMALAATKDRIANVDYAVFEDSRLESLDITIQQTEVGTPDNMVNSLHYELGNLTVKQLANLAKIIATSTHERTQQARIRSGLLESVSNGRLNREKIKPDLLQRLSSSIHQTLCVIDL